MADYLGRRTRWLRLLIIPSQRLLFRLDDSDLGDDVDFAETFTLRFTPADPLATEIVWTGVSDGPTSVLFAIEPEDVNAVILACGAGSRMVRLTVGNDVWSTGYFEIDGVW